MSSQAERKRRRKERNRILASQPDNPASNHQPVQDRADTKPTAEAQRHGRYVRTNDARDAPWVNRHVDMIARLGAEGKLSDPQVDAARLWQEVHGRFLDELGVERGRSCLDISAGGYDGGDGNPAAVQAYYSLIKRLGAVRSARLGIEVGKGPQDMPDNINGLRRALDAVNA